MDTSRFRRNLIVGGGSGEPLPPNNEIWYTSTDGNIVNPYSQGVSIFGANIVSNTYVDGKGVIVFDGVYTKFGAWCFYNRQTLQTVVWHKDIMAIELNAFRGCINLLLSEIPESVRRIGAAAFLACFKIDIKKLHLKLESLAMQAFHGCTGIPSLTFTQNIPISMDYRGSFDGTSFPIYVPASAVDTYKSATGWSNYADRIFPIPE